MLDHNILVQMALEKRKRVLRFMTQYLGHTPSPEERKKFTLMHSMKESKVCFEGRVIGHLMYETSSYSRVAEIF